MKISILIPSRGRPDKLLKLAQSAFNTSSCDIEILAYIDKSDPSKPQYKTLPEVDKRIKIVIGADSTVAWAVNILAEMATGDAIMTIGDDTIFYTHTWDKAVIDTAAKYPEGMWMCGFNDGRGGFSHVVYDKEWFKCLGYWWPPIFNHWGADEWLTTIAQSPHVNRYEYYDDILIKHEKVGDACPTDETYARIRGNTNRDRDHWLKDHMKRYWQADLNAVISHLGSLKARNTKFVKNYVRTHE